MSLSDALKKHPAAAVVLAVVLLAVALWRPWSGSAGSGMAITGTWYYDLQSRQLVEIGADAGRPPVTLPSGAVAVEAHVFGCGGCDGQTFVGHLARWSDEAKRYFENPDGQSLDPATMQLVAAPPDEGQEPVWIVSSRPDAAAVTNVASRCPGGDIVECYP